MPASGVSSSLSNLSLQDLDLGQNNLGDQGITLLARTLVHNRDSSLRRINLSWNNVGVSEYAALSELSKSRPHLQVVNVDE